MLPPRRAADGTPPLLVLLHGIGADEDDLLPLAAALDPRFQVASLRAPRPYQGGFAWFDVAFRGDGPIVPDVAQARASVGDLARWLAAAPARLGADPQRVYLLGFSQGATMGLAMLVAAPDRVAGVVALSGRFEDALVPRPGAHAALARTSVFVAHGTADRLLPVADGRAIRDRFAPVVRDFTYREYPTGHAIAAETVRDVTAWLAARLDRPGVN